MDDFLDTPIESEFEQSEIDNRPLEEIIKPSTAPQKLERYTIAKFEAEVFGTDCSSLIRLLEYKCNIILQGSPGVGKTFTGKRLAYAMMGVKDDSRVLQVQFHQSYTYDDFVIGLRPLENGGFKFVPGPFYNFCKKAQNDPQHRSHFMIIDEINRGNMSKILGEAFSLIEKDHRNEEITLKSNDEKFSVPDNLYIIGTMNTADRGLVMLDYALRRRFAFITVEPKYSSQGFRALMTRSGNVKFNRLVKRIEELNKAISLDSMLGPGFMIGHSYFCLRNAVTDEDLKHIVIYEIIPLLEEYWYDNPEKVAHWKSLLLSALKDRQMG